MRANPRPQPRTKSLKPGLKNALISAAIWGLVVVNVVLIMSMVFKLLRRNDYKPASIIEKTALDVELLNGCGVKGVANTFSELLKREGFDVVNVENAERFDYENTIVIDRRAVSRENANLVARTLGVDKDKVLPMPNADAQLDVTVIIGADYKNLKAYNKLR